MTLAFSQPFFSVSVSVSSVSPWFVLTHVPIRAPLFRADFEVIEDGSPTLTPAANEGDPVDRPDLLTRQFYDDAETLIRLRILDLNVQSGFTRRPGLDFTITG